MRLQDAIQLVEEKETALANADGSLANAQDAQKQIEVKLAAAQIVTGEKLADDQAAALTTTLALDELAAAIAERKAELASKLSVTVAVAA